MKLFCHAIGISILAILSCVTLLGRFARLGQRRCALSGQMESVVDSVDLRQKIINSLAYASFEQVRAAILAAEQIKSRRPCGAESIRLELQVPQIPLA